MKMAAPIMDIGLSTVYKPDTVSPIVDIVIIHGLQGHPYKTWVSTKALKTDSVPSDPKSSEVGSKLKDGVKRSIVSRLNRTSSEKTASKAAESAGGSAPSVFWPADLLPEQCPSARILMYGYDTKVSKYMAGATNMNSIFSHAKDLLFALGRERVTSVDRPLIFVAHSLGGILVKEMLSRSSVSSDSSLKSIASSTKAVIFLGTPHRGNPDLAALGEWARSIVSAFRMETNSAILDALGLKTTDLERAQEDFSRLWQRFNFRVKTFQEGRGLSGINLGVLGNKVVPDYSSLIGDQLENAETIDANHMDMCRFTRAEDPNYRKVAGEIRFVYLLTQSSTQKTHQIQPGYHNGMKVRAATPKNTPHDADKGDFSSEEKVLLRSLWFPHMESRLNHLQKPAEGTCCWLFEHEMYKDWFSGRTQEQHQGLLWLKGKPGSGKSILMKEAFRQVALEQANSNHWSASFFFNGKGDKLEHSSFGFYRSLLYQLLPRYRAHLQDFSEAWNAKIKHRRNIKPERGPWEESELRSMLQSVFARRSARKVLVFVDALDECDTHTMRPVAYFLREITRDAYIAGVDLKVCLASRHFPNITLDSCPEIAVDRLNGSGIKLYVEQKFKLGFATAEPRWERLRDKIIRKSNGMFLWVVLAVEDMLRKWDDGTSVQYLCELSTIPQKLEDLFSRILLSSDPATRYLTVRLFQWIILATRPLRLHEWHHMLGFIREPVPASLAEWRASENFTENDAQLERQLRSISKGLVEVKSGADDAQDITIESTSVLAGAGSLDLEHGETRVVQVIHESVRDFFLKGNGFSVLDPSLGLDPISSGNFSIMGTCLDYLKIKELDALLLARMQAYHYGKTKLEGRKQFTSRSFVPSYSAAFSEVSSFVDLHTTAKYFQGNLLSSQKLEELSVYETLTKLCGPAAGMDVSQWISSVPSFLEYDSLNEAATSDSRIEIPVTAQPQVLEVYPALLFYALFELFTHAKRAEKQGADPKHIINRLLEDKTWSRWVMLREDIPPETTLYSFVAKRTLRRWIDHLAPMEIEEILNESMNVAPKEKVDSSRAQKEVEEILNESTKIASNEKLKDNRAPDEANNSTIFEKRSPRRAGSVASFASAGSYAGGGRSRGRGGRGGRGRGRGRGRGEGPASGYGDNTRGEGTGTNRGEDTGTDRGEDTGLNRGEGTSSNKAECNNKASDGDKRRGDFSDGARYKAKGSNEGRRRPKGRSGDGDRNGDHDDTKGCDRGRKRGRGGRYRGRARGRVGPSEQS